MTRRQELNLAASRSAVRLLERYSGGFREGPESLQRARAALARLEAQLGVGAAQGGAQGDLLDPTPPSRPSWER